MGLPFVIAVLLASSSFHANAASYAGRLTYGRYNVGVPEQVSLGLGPTQSSCVISWLNQLQVSPSLHYYESSKSFDGANASIYYGEVQMGLTEASMTLERGYSSIYAESRCGSLRLVSSVTIPDCFNGTTFVYRVRNVETQVKRIVPVTNFTRLYNGRMLSAKTTHLPTSIGLVADMSAYSAEPGDTSSINAIANFTAIDAIDVFVHVGDIAYNVDDDCGLVGDTYFKAVEAIRSRVPNVLALGDHEEGRKDILNTCHYRTGYDYESYMMRMGAGVNGGQLLLAHRSGSTTLHYFSFQVNLIHFVVVNTNAWIHGCLYWLLSPMMIWLDRDLSSVDREQYPWVIVLGHRAMYCTKSEDSECNAEAESIRYGVPNKAYEGNINIANFQERIRDNDNRFGLEKILWDHKVDMYIAGHTHHYQRSWPVFDDGVTQNDYVSPKATVHMQIGLSGVTKDEFKLPPRGFEAFRDITYSESWGHLQVYNSTVLTWTQRRARDNHKLDFFSIEKAHMKGAGIEILDKEEAAVA